jgi:anaerobic magnesium-protoporphyrin IX monomethyl ester cyclase
MKKDIILIRPPRNSSDRAYVSLQVPLNLGYLAAYLIKFGFQAQVWDFEVQVFGKDFIQKMKELKFPPGLFGITALTPTLNNAHRIAAGLKENFPAVPIVLGGPHASVFPEETLREFPNFDIVVIGEGEEALKEVCLRVVAGKTLEGVRGIAYRDNSKIARGKDREPIDDLDSIPFPARELFNNKLYRGHHVSRGFSRRFLNIAEIITSRGCVYNCIFCGGFRRKLSFRSLPNVLAEIEECKNTYQARHFSILDEVFTFDKKRVVEFCEGVKKIGGITWDCYSRVDHASQELLGLMAESGCQKVSFGVESGSQRILDRIGKGITVQQVKNVSQMARKAGLRYLETSFLIGGHPDENKDDIALTYALIKDIRPDILVLSVAVPYPGTGLYAMLTGEGYIKKGTGWDDFNYSSDNLCWRTRYFDSKQLIKIRNSMLNKFYLRFYFIFKKIFTAKSLNELIYWKDMGIGFLRNITFSGKIGL